jgi:hypothetical protein
MKNLNFNIYGFIAPQTKAEYASLLQEALLIADDLQKDIEQFGATLTMNALETAH